MLYLDNQICELYFLGSYTYVALRTNTTVVQVYNTLLQQRDTPMHDILFENGKGSCGYEFG